jgi:hypothetical protein
VADQVHGAGTNGLMCSAQGSSYGEVLAC